MGLQHWWKNGAAPNDYESGLAEERFEGQPVAYLRSIMQQARSFGAFCQTIAAEDYRGKRIRFSATLKANNLTDGWGGLWLRVDGARLDETLAIDTMEDRPWSGRPAGSSTRWCSTWPRRRPRSPSGLGGLGWGAAGCHWPLRRSAARCRSPPAPIAHDNRRTSTSARPSSPGRPPGVGRPDRPSDPNPMASDPPAGASATGVPRPALSAAA